MYISSVYFSAILNRFQAKSLDRGLLQDQKSSTFLQTSLPLLFPCTPQHSVCAVRRLNEHAWGKIFCLHVVNNLKKTQN